MLVSTQQTNVMAPLAMATAPQEELGARNHGVNGLLWQFCTLLGFSIKLNGFFKNMT